MKGLLALAVLAAALLVASAPAGAQSSPPPGWGQVGPAQDLHPGLAGLRLPSPRHATGITLEQLGHGPASGTRQVVIHLLEPPVAELPTRDPARRQAHLAGIDHQQGLFLARAEGSDWGFREVATLRLVLNAVIAEVKVDLLPEIMADPAVSHVAPVVDYELALSETVPYIGAAPLHDLDVDGRGVRVAVLDTGIDYTHFNLLGPGMAAAYEAAYGSDPSDPRNSSPNALFPTDKVVGGYDFLGEFWPFGPMAPNPNPIDFNGHGTHVADIIGGRRGVAPGVELYALKVCASLSSVCSGAALLQAMEFAVDPDGDGNPDDRVDIVNMSLGASYGQPFDDSLSAAVDNATRLGVLTVAASGNAGDRPYVTATPAAAPTAISVAQTQVPSAFLPSISVLEPAAFRGQYPAAFQPWSAPLSAPVQGPVQYGDEAGGNRNGCAPFPPGSLEGKIVVVDRGVCFFSDKIRHVQQAGGVLGIIAMVESGPPFAGAFGGGSPITIPAYMVGRADGDILRRGSAVVRLAPGQGISLAGTVVDTSSRGPEMQGHTIKPELSAPGASVSAEPGTGTGERPFGGTSGATPMVAGAAALLMQAHIGYLEADPTLEEVDPPARLTPLEVKARLMNTAHADLRNSPQSAAAPVSRVGGGEVRIDRAVATPFAAWDIQFPSGALGFGFVDVADAGTTVTRQVRLRNYSSRPATFTLGYGFQFADDAAGGAVSLSLPDSVTVEGRSDAVFTVALNIDGTRLRDNRMNSGPQGSDPAPLTAHEYDGYITLHDGEHTLRLAWHVLPRKSARLALDPAQHHAAYPDGGVYTLLNSLDLTNTGVAAAQNQAYSLLALSPRRQPGGRGRGAPTPDLRAIGVRAYDVPGGFCSAAPSYVLSFAVNTWQRQAHANWPGVFLLHLDTDQDGVTDYTVFNGDAGLEAGVSLGQSVTWVLDHRTGDLSARFFTEHAMNTANTVLHLCATQIGSPAPQQYLDVVATARDAYFGGPGDSVSGITFAPYGVGQLSASPADIPAGESGSMSVTGATQVQQRAVEPGLLVFTNSDRGPASRGGATADTEALVFVPPALDRSPTDPALLDDRQPQPAPLEPVSPR